MQHKSKLTGFLSRTGRRIGAWLLMLVVRAVIKRLSGQRAPKSPSRTPGGKKDRKYVKNQAD